MFNHAYRLAFNGVLGEHIYSFEDAAKFKACIPNVEVHEVKQCAIAVNGVWTGIRYLTIHEYYALKKSTPGQVEIKSL